MKRRSVLYGLTGGLAATGLTSPALAQSAPRVGVLLGGDIEPTWSQFRKAMTQLGYGEARKVVYEMRQSSAATGKLDDYARELVRLNVDVIMAVLTPAVLAATRATTSIPIVFNGGVPHLVKNHGRPEGNLTGVFTGGAAVAGKNLQLFREARPSTKSFGALLNVADPFHLQMQPAMEEAALAEKIELVLVRINAGSELPAAFESLAKRGVEGVLVQPSLGIHEAAALSLKYRVPAVSFRRELAESGGLFSYAPDLMAVNQIAAGYVDRLLRGAKIADLPTQRSDRYELVVNLKSAAELGIKLPNSFLARADEIIE